MKKVLIAGITMVSLLVCVSSLVFTSELSYLGIAPISKDSETGIGFNMVNTGTGTVNLNSDSLALEFFYRRCDAESFDWGFSLSPMYLSSLPGSPDFLFDLKARLIKGVGIIPSFCLGVNLVRIRNIDFSNLSFDPIFVDECRLGLSWEFISYKGKGKKKEKSVKVKRNIIYAGVNIIPGGSEIGNRFTAGAKFGGVNFTVVFEDELSLIGFGYAF